MRSKRKETIPIRPEICCLCAKSLKDGFGVLFVTPDGQEARVDQSCWTLLDNLCNSPQQEIQLDAATHLKELLPNADPLVCEYLQMQISQVEEQIHGRKEEMVTEQESFGVQRDDNSAPQNSDVAIQNVSTPFPSSHATERTTDLPVPVFNRNEEPAIREQDTQPSITPVPNFDQKKPYELPLNEEDNPEAEVQKQSVLDMDDIQEPLPVIPVMDKPQRRNRVPKEKKETSRSKKRIFALLGIAVFLGVCATLYFVFGKTLLQSNNAQKEENKAALIDFLSTTPTPTSYIEEAIVTQATNYTSEPTEAPTEEPSEVPTEEPTVEPTLEPTAEPTTEPTMEPTEEPTPVPTEVPTEAPTALPTQEPTEEPVEQQSDAYEESTDELEDVSANQYPTKGKTTAKKVNVRVDADQKSKRVAYITNKGTEVTIIGEKTDQSGNLWYKVEINDKKGFVLSSVIETDSVTEEQKNRFPFKAKTTTKKVNVRAKADPKGRRVKYLAKQGTVVLVADEVKGADGEMWYKVQLDSGEVGYAMSKYFAPLVEATPVITATPEPEEGVWIKPEGNELYGLAIKKIAARNGPSTQFDDMGTYFLEGQYVKVIARAWDATQSSWWVKCEIPYHGEIRILWTDYYRFDSSTLPIDSIPLE